MRTYSLLDNCSNIVPFSRHSCGLVLKRRDGVSVQRPSDLRLNPQVHTLTRVFWNEVVGDGTNLQSLGFTLCKTHGYLSISEPLRLPCVHALALECSTTLLGGDVPLSFTWGFGGDTAHS